MPRCASSPGPERLAGLKFCSSKEVAARICKAQPACKVETQHVDVVDKAQVKASIEACVAKFGQLDVALSIAGAMLVPARTCSPRMSSSRLTYARTQV
jgi:NADP-dependent 3-hydroxy acid dehydrogenase YdfG